jgi:hypothetical protein
MKAMSTAGPANIQAFVPDFWGEQIHQTWDRILKKDLKRANI